MTTAADIAAGLTKSAAMYDDLAVHWDDFTDANPLKGRNIDEYLRDMETNGYAALIAVDDDALDDAFAWERGIEAGGMMWTLTPLGLEVRRILLANAEGPQHG